MKVSNLLAFSIGVGACIVLDACGGSDNNSSSGGGGTTTPPPSTPQTLMLSVTDVSNYAQVKSETADPFTVNGGTIGSASDNTADPVAID